MSSSHFISAAEFGKHPRLNAGGRTVRRWADCRIIPKKLLKKGPKGRTQFRSPTEEQVSKILDRLQKRTGKRRIRKSTSTELHALYEKSRAGNEYYTAVALAYSFLDNKADAVESLLALAEAERMALIKGEISFENCLYIMDADEFFIRDHGVHLTLADLTPEQRYPSAFVDENGLLFNSLPGKPTIGFPLTHPFSSLLKDRDKLNLLVCCRRAARNHKYGRVTDKGVAEELKISPNTFRKNYLNTTRFGTIYEHAKNTFDKDHLTLPTKLTKTSQPTTFDTADDDKAFIGEQTTTTAFDLYSERGSIS